MSGDILILGGMWICIDFLVSPGSWSVSICDDFIVIPYGIFSVMLFDIITGVIVGVA